MKQRHIINYFIIGIFLLFFVTGCTRHEPIKPTGIYNDTEYAFSLQVPVEWEIVGGYLDQRVISVSPREEFEHESFRENIIVKLFPLFDGDKQKTEEDIIASFSEELKQKGFREEALSVTTDLTHLQLWAQDGGTPGSILTYYQKVSPRLGQEEKATTSSTVVEATPTNIDKDVIVLYFFSSRNQDTMEKWLPVFLQYIEASLQAEKDFVLKQEQTIESGENPVESDPTGTETDQNPTELSSEGNQDDSKS